MALMDDGWEARMADRAAARHVVREAEQALLDAEATAELQAVLARVNPAVYHGWPLNDDRTTVYVGGASYCAGCGHLYGVGCSVWTDATIEWAKDRPVPDWPFTVDACPIRKMDPYSHKY
jgi:hypothetical protein